MKLTAWDRFTAMFSPESTLRRVRSRAALEKFARHYEAATPGRRTSGWARSYGDANAVIVKAAPELRLHARDLVRNNAWASSAVEIITSNAVGWGIQAKAVGDDRATELWRSWAESTHCDSEELLTFAGIQELVLRTVAQDGECLVRRRRRDPAKDKHLPIPLALQVLEADYLDHSHDGLVNGVETIGGVEFDPIGRRQAYWIFDRHPGNARAKATSRKVPAEDVIHVYRPLRPGQARGVTWLATTIVPLKDFDEYEDAQLLKQKIAACFAGFVSDPDGLPENVGGGTTDDGFEEIQPGTISYLKPGRQVSFASPPSATPDGFDVRTLRRIAAGISVPYEEMTGDYSQVNFSSARMARLRHWGMVYKWRHNMLIPQLCDGVWAWAMEQAVVAGKLPAVPTAHWTAPPMPMIEPDKEGLAYQRLIRGGLLTLSEAIRAQGYDPDTFLPEFAADLKKLDELGIKLDSDPRATSQAGLTQERAGAGGPGKKPPAEEDRSIDVDLSE